MRNAPGQPQLSEQQRAQLLKNQQALKDQQQMALQQQNAKRPGAPGSLQATRKPSTPGGTKRDNASKSPTIRRPKEITYARLRMVQQKFKGNELKSDEDIQETGADADVKPVDETGKTPEEAGAENGNGEADKKGEAQVEGAE